MGYKNELRIVSVLLGIMKSSTILQVRLECSMELAGYWGAWCVQ